MKIQKILMTGPRDVGENLTCFQNVGIPALRKIKFFPKSLSYLYPYGACPNFMTDDLQGKLSRPRHAIPRSKIRVN